MELSRRDCLAATGSALLAGALSIPAEADGEKSGETLYGHGLVWNQKLLGVPGELKLAFDMWINVDAGTGLGTAHDSVHPDWNIHFAIGSLTSEKRPKGETRFTMTGAVTQAIDPLKVGMTVRIVAETNRDATAVTIQLGDLGFGGAGLIVRCDLLCRTLLCLLCGCC